MAIHYRTQGLILKKADRGEADQLFTIYTRDFGKLEILGKAIRKIKSKLRSGAELFYLSEIEFIQGKTHKTLTDAILIDKFENLRKDMNELTIAYEISGILDNLINGQEPDAKIWHLLLETFDKLNTKYPEAIPSGCYGAGKIQDTTYKIYYYFFWNLLSFLGYQPELYNCARCQGKLEPENLYFSSREGGTICNNCQKLVKSVKSVKKIEPDTVKILRILLKRDWNTLKKLKTNSFQSEALKNISEDYYSLVLAELTPQF